MHILPILSITSLVRVLMVIFRYHNMILYNVYIISKSTYVKQGVLSLSKSCWLYCTANAIQLLVNNFINSLLRWKIVSGHLKCSDFKGKHSQWLTMKMQNTPTSVLPLEEQTIIPNLVLYPNQKLWLILLQANNDVNSKFLAYQLQFVSAQQTAILIWIYF